MHLFVECVFSADLWKKSFEYLNNNFQCVFSLTCKNILWGCYENKKYVVINYFCLVTKQYIYAQRCMNNDEVCECFK